MDLHGVRALVLRALVASLFVLASTACQSAVGLGATCARSSDCTAPLACSYGRCRTACRASRDCSPGVRCIEIAGGGVCTLDTEERCTDAICAAPLRCVDGQCRTECVGPEDCRGGVCDRGTCVEVVSGTDAGSVDVGIGTDAAPDAPPDAPTQIDGGTCDVATGVGHDMLLDVILGTPRGPAGLGVVPIGRIGPFVSPQTPARLVPAQIALAAIGGADEAWVGYLEGAAGGTPDRALRIARVALDDAGHPTTFYPDGVSERIDHVESFALASDGSTIHGVAVREAPPGATDTSAWVFDRGSPMLVIHPLSAMRTPPRAQPGRVTIVGGQSGFSSVAGPEAFFVFREHDAVSPFVEMLTRVNLALDLASLVEIDTRTFLPAGFVETDASHGALVIAYDAVGGRVLSWDQRSGRTGSFVTIVSDATGAPSIVAEPGSAVRSVVGYPRGSEIAFRGIDCPAGGIVDCAASARAIAFPSTSGFPVGRVDMAPVGSGYAFAAVEAEASTGSSASIPIRHVMADLGSGVWDCDSGVPCIADVFPASELGAGERIADVQLATATNARGVSILLAVLIRDDAARQDRIWIGGLFACRG